MKHDRNMIEKNKLIGKLRQVQYNLDGMARNKYITKNSLKYMLDLIIKYIEDSELEDDQIDSFEETFNPEDLGDLEVLLFGYQ